LGTDRFAADDSSWGFHPLFVAGSNRHKLLTPAYSSQDQFDVIWFLSKSIRVTTQSTLRGGWLKVVLQRKAQLRSTWSWLVRCVDESCCHECVIIGCGQYLEGTLLQYDSGSPALLRGCGRPHVRTCSSSTVVPALSYPEWVHSHAGTYTYG